MAVWSRLLEVSLPYNCYEVVHTWEPDCSIVALTSGGSAFYQAMKLYAPFYLVPYLMRRKFTWETTNRTFYNFLLSASILGFHSFYLSLFNCLTRKFMGSYYNLISSFLPAFAAALVCYNAERENRRRTVAVYIANAATETALRMAIARGIVKPYPNADVYLFSATISVFLYLIKKWGFFKDPVSGVIKFLLGEDEAKKSDEKLSRENLSLSKKQPFLEKIISNLSIFKDAFRGTRFHRICSLKHASCSHETSCIFYCLQGLLRPFLMGYLASFLLRCFALRRKLIRSPKLLTALSAEKKNFNLGLFLGGFGGTFKMVNCLLRWCVGKDLPVYAIPAGLLGGLFVKFFPSSTMSLYLLWKLMEFLYLSGIEAGVLPHVQGFLPLLLTASFGFLFHAAVLEPHNLKPSFFKFLKQLTNNRLSEFNRRAMDIFGTHASTLRPDFWPLLDHRYTSDKFKTIALLWLHP